MHPPDVAKWCAYIDDEIDRRTTTTHAGLEPELVIVVDDLDEFLEPNPAAAATVQRIIDRGPDLGIRLIVSTKQLHPDGDLWTVPAFGPAVRFRPDTVIAFSTFRREESMAALGTRRLEPAARPGPRLHPTRHRTRRHPGAHPHRQQRRRSNPLRTNSRLPAQIARPPRVLCASPVSPRRGANSCGPDIGPAPPRGVSAAPF